jgi:hypothetical protein
MNKIKLIGLLGRKMSGKDTVADYVVKKNNFKKVHIASHLKEGIKIFFSFSDEQLYGNKKDVMDKRWNKTPRECLQYIGTDIFRKEINKFLPNVKDNFWIDSVINSLNNENTIIADVRFQNEVNIIKQKGGIIIKLTRDSTEKDTHLSEIGIDLIMNYDYLIKNDNCIDNLYKNINMIEKEIKYNLLK